VGIHIRPTTYLGRYCCFCVGWFSLWRRR